MSQRGTLISLVLVVVSARASAEAPWPVSPRVDGDSAVVPSQCPVFQWAAEDGAESIRLVVYRVPETEFDAAPQKVVEVELPGSARGWTPSLPDCLEPGGRYAWSLGAGGGWSEAVLFEIDSAPSATEVREAVDVLTRYLEGAADRPGLPAADTVAADEVGDTAVAGIDPPLPAGAAGDPDADLLVAGEVRTVDSAGEPRAWGRGRPDLVVYPEVGTGDYCTTGNSTKFGLSSVVVDWGSATDACPVGTWVCRTTEIVACDTDRPDSNADFRLCDGSPADRPEMSHAGWVAEAVLFDDGRTFNELGVAGLALTCLNLPVWCCWD